MLEFYLVNIHDGSTVFAHGYSFKDACEREKISVRDYKVLSITSLLD